MRTRSEINSTGWFGHIPDGWEMKPIKALFRFSKGLSITKADLSEHGVPVVSYGQIHSKDYNGTGITKSLIRYVPKSVVQNSSSSRVKHGGFIFADTSEDLAGVGNCSYNDGNEDLFGGYHTIVANPLFSSENKYFAYLFRTDAWRKQLRNQLVDVKLFSVNQSILGESYVVMPPRDVQRSIVAFLDSRCKPLNEAIARHRIIIDKLEDYRKAIITKAVTRGLDENVMLVETGYPWLGEIPEHWRILKLNFFAHSVLGRMLDQKQENGINVHRYLSNRDVQWFNINTSDLSTMSFPPNSQERYGLKRGDLLICEGGEVGRCAIWNEDDSDIYFQKAIHRLRINRSVAFPEFIAYQMFQKAKSNRFIEVRRGEATISHLPGDQLNMLKFVIPSLHEQSEIISYLDYKCAAIDEGINRQEQVIAKLEEYRRSLIFHAVTGRIDCTGGAC